MPKGSDARVWLRESGYVEVADLIDEIMAEWRAAGLKTRRNWWDKLAGQRNGSSCEVSGRRMPVLRAAQIRQGRVPTPNAVSRDPAEEPPVVRRTNRWPT